MDHVPCYCSWEGRHRLKSRRLAVAGIARRNIVVMGGRGNQNCPAQ